MFQSGKQHGVLVTCGANCAHEVTEEGNEVENKTKCKPATIQTTTMKARKISDGNPDLATITRIEMLIPVVCPLWSFRRPDSSEVLS